MSALTDAIKVALASAEVSYRAGVYESFPIEGNRLVVRSTADGLVIENPDKAVTR
jgi:hypothetical protein